MTFISREGSVLRCSNLNAENCLWLERYFFSVVGRCIGGVEKLGSVKCFLLIENIIARFNDRNVENSTNDKME